MTTIGPAISVPQMITVQMKVYTKSKEDIRKAEESLKQMIHREFESSTYDISNLESEQVLQLRQKANNFNLTIEVETEKSQIKITGRKDSVQQLKDIITEMLHEIEKMAFQTEAEAQLRKANEREAFIQAKVKWQYSSTKIEYDPDINYQIERAYTLYVNQETSDSTFKYANNKSQYIIYFDRSPMQEEDCVIGDLVNIERNEAEES